MQICPCSLALGLYKNVGIRTYLGLVTAESVRFFHHFVFCIKVLRFATFFIAPKNCIFWGTSFVPIKNLAPGNFGYLEVTSFSWNPHIPLLHPTSSHHSYAFLLWLECCNRGIWTARRGSHACHEQQEGCHLQSAASVEDLVNVRAKRSCRSRSQARLP